MRAVAATAPWSFQELRSSLARDLVIEPIRRELRAEPLVETDTRVLVGAGPFA